MSDKKKTAVQWLLEQWPILESQLPKAIINNALQMEREQIIDAFSEGTKMIDINNELSARFNACVYYVENYEGQDEN
jgi:hypothetical protein